MAATRITALSLADWPLIAAGLFLLFVFAVGGSSAYDVQSLPLLRPIAVIAAGTGLLRLQPRQLHAVRYPLGLIVAAMTLCLLYLVPLPPALWQSLPGRGLAVEATRIVGLDGQWRPASLVPKRTETALFALFVPLAMLAWIAPLPWHGRRRLLPLLIAILAASALFGIAQWAPPSPVYLYANTTIGAADGLFANRNHHGVAMACLLLMIGTQWITAIGAGRLRLAIAWAAGGAMSVVAILLIGSRNGLAMAVVALLCLPVLWISGLRGMPGAAPRPLRWGAGGMLLLLLSAAGTTSLVPEQAVSRIVTDAARDSRPAIWKTSAEAAAGYFPIGSGPGTFADVYKIGEADAALGSLYINHAHDEPLEVAMTAGLAGFALLIAATLIWLAATARWLRATDRPSDERTLALLGAAIILVLGLASLADYPLRVPSIQCLLVIAAAWMTGSGRPEGATHPSTGGAPSKGDSE